MRAGGFAEDRVIRLIDRRFVPFFFNRSGMGEGGDDDATKFVDGQTDNPYAYFAAFKPTGELVGETKLYADKNAIMVWLTGLLTKHPEFAVATAEERELLAAGALPAARLAEDLGDYDDATQRYQKLSQQDDASIKSQALLGLLRIHRHEGAWRPHEQIENQLRAGADEAALMHADVERGHRLLAHKQFADARRVLQPLTVRAGDSPRLAEAHFSAGLACWYLDDLDWAKFHWCWIVENMPNDRLYMRARIAAAAEGMPYPNFELGDYKPNTGNIGTHNIVAAVDAATDVFRQMQPLYDAGTFTKARPRTAEADEQAPATLVAKLRDGNAHVAANNRIVDRLRKLGEPSIAPLIAAVADKQGEGRGYSAWALARVLDATGSRDKRAMTTLQNAAKDDTQYVKTLSASGLNMLARANAGQASPARQDGEDVTKIDSSLLLVSRLRDGNDHVRANNQVVSRLETIGEAAVSPLIAAIRDKHFPGRGYAAWALSQVLKANALQHAQAMEALQTARRDDDGYVAELARSGLSTLPQGKVR